MQTLIRWILSKLAGITAQQWAAALQWVIIAAREMQGKSGAEKRQKVADTLTKTWPHLSGWVGNLLIEVALAWARREGKA